MLGLSWSGGERGGALDMSGYERREREEWNYSGMKNFKVSWYLYARDLNNAPAAALLVVRRARLRLNCNAGSGGWVLKNGIKSEGGSWG